MKIYTGESLAKQLNYWGVGCEFIRHIMTPQTIVYKFNLTNPLDIKKARKLRETLELLTNNAIKMAENDGESHFNLIFTRSEREFINIGKFAKTMTTAKPFSVALGVDQNGEHITKTLDELTHILVAGTTGSGKSISINTAIMSLCCYNQPSELGLILIDPKRVEFAKFQNLPHLIVPVIQEMQQAYNILTQLVDEMDSRYYTLEKLGKVQNKGEFKKIVLVIDELTDLVMTNKEIKNLLVRILQKGRACGIHCIIGTQSPRAKILDGVTLANLPSRLALTCASVRESCLILGHKGAEQLQGKGDAILKTPEDTKETRLQAPYISTSDINKLIKPKETKQTKFKFNKLFKNGSK